MEFSRLQIPRKSNERLRFGELKIVRPCLRPRFATEKQLAREDAGWLRSCLRPRFATEKQWQC